jgi:hypothetical protein
MEEIIGFTLEFIAIQTGRLIVWLVSFGRWRGEAWRGNEGRIYGPAGGMSFVRDGQRVITVTSLLFIGIAFYVALIALVVALLVMM